jgi:uncharacterized protein YbaR (Trm112 family)
MINPDLLKILACPICKSDLEYVEIKKNEYLKCLKCNLYYPVKEDIPILLEDEALKEEDVKRN